MLVRQCWHFVSLASRYSSRRSWRQSLRTRGRFGAASPAFRRARQRWARGSPSAWSRSSTAWSSASSAACEFRGMARWSPACPGASPRYCWCRRFGLAAIVRDRAPPPIRRLQKGKPRRANVRRGANVGPDLANVRRPAERSPKMHERSPANRGQRKHETEDFNNIAERLRRQT